MEEVGCFDDRNGDGNIYLSKRFVSTSQITELDRIRGG